MKKFMILLAGLSTALSAQAQMVPDASNSPYHYSYSQDRVNQGYNPPRTYQLDYANGSYYGNAPVVAAPPSAQVYGFYQQPAQVNQAPRQQQMMWYPTQQQRAVAAGQVYVNPVYDIQEQQPQQRDVYQSPVYNSKAARHKRSFYADLHLGIGSTMGWSKGFDDPVGPIWGVAIGTRLSPTLRVEAAFDYHTKAELAKVAGAKVEYRQYALGANVYYDFPVNASLGFQPFIGGGIWGVKGKANAAKNGYKVADADSDVKLGLSVSTGIVYPFNDMFSAVAMARARYINTKEDLFNLQGLVGLRYNF